MNTPKILEEASRHFRHNYGNDVFVCGFDSEQTIEIVNKLEKDNQKLKEYAQHKFSCFKIRDIQPKTDKCTCGLEELLKDRVCAD